MLDSYEGSLSEGESLPQSSWATAPILASMWPQEEEEIRTEQVQNGLRRAFEELSGSSASRFRAAQSCLAPPLRLEGLSLLPNTRPPLMELFTV